MNAHQFPPQRRPYPSCPFVDLPALPSDHRLSETNPHFWLNPSPPTLPRQYLPCPKQKISECATLLSRYQKKPSRTPAATTQREKRNDFNTLQKPQEDGTPCRGNGLDQLDGYCIAHAPAGKAWQWRSRGGKASSAAARADKRIPDRLRRAIEKLSTGMDQVLRASSPPAAAPAASCPPPPVCCHAPKTFSRNLS